MDERAAVAGLDMTAAWRAQSPLRRDILFLNPGTLGGTLRVATRRADALRRRWLRDGAGAALDLAGADAYQHMRRSTDGARRSLAAWLAVEPRRVALTGNATDGLHLALLSVDWQSGDHVLATDQEHGALDYALERLAARVGVVVDRIAFPAAECDRAVEERVRRGLDARTRLVAVSHVSCRSGVTVDVPSVVRALSGHDAILLVDGAHAAGTRLPVVHEGVDFYAFPGHKWLFGPVGTGVLVVSPRALAETSPLLRGAPSLDREGRELDSLDGAWRYESGTRDWAAVAGLEAAVAFRRQFAEEAILAHYERLTAAFLAGLADRFPVTGAGPVLNLVMPSDTAWEIGRRLWRAHRAIVKPTPDGIRVTLGPWLERDEAERAGTLLATPG